MNVAAAVAVPLILVFAAVVGCLIYANHRRAQRAASRDRGWQAPPGGGPAGYGKNYATVLMVPQASLRKDGLAGVAASRQPWGEAAQAQQAAATAAGGGAEAWPAPTQWAAPTPTWTAVADHV